MTASGDFEVQVSVGSEVHSEIGYLIIVDQPTCEQTKRDSIISRVMTPEFFHKQGILYMVYVCLLLRKSIQA